MITVLTRITTIFAVFAATAIASAPSEAGFAEGMSAYARGDMKIAVRELLPPARANDSRAQFLLAQIYETSGIAPKEGADAVMWYRRAAINGVVAAMRRLGDIYRNGRGRESDPVQAYAWYDLASSRIGPHRASFSRIRDDIASKLPPPALAHARHLAVYWRGDFAKIGVMIPPPPQPKRSSPAEVFKSKELPTKAGDSATATESRVRRVQTALAARGYKVGSIDGIMGPRTGAAIRAFQSDQGLAPNGVVTSGLIERLEGDAEEG